MQLSVREGPPQKPSPQGPHPPRSLSVGGRRVTSSQASGFRAALRPLAPASGSQSIRLYFQAQTAWHSLAPSIRVQLTCTHLGKSVYNHFLRSSLGRQTQTVLDLNVQCQFLLVVTTFIALLSERKRPYGEEVERASDPELSVFLISPPSLCFSCRVWVQRWVVRALLERLLWVSDLPCFVLVFKGRALFR